MTQLLPHSSHIALLWLPQIYSHLPHSRGRSPTKARLCFPHGNLGFSHVAARLFFLSPHQLTATANNTDTSCDGRSNCDITVEPSGTKLKKEGSRKSVELTLKRQMCHFFHTGISENSSSLKLVQYSKTCILSKYITKYIVHILYRNAQRARSVKKNANSSFGKAYLLSVSQNNLRNATFEILC